LSSFTVVRISGRAGLAAVNSRAVREGRDQQSGREELPMSGGPAPATVSSGGLDG